MTKKEALAEFKRDVLPAVIQRYGKNDVPAKCEAWNDWTDALCKERRITSSQYSTWANPF